MAVDVAAFLGISLLVIATPGQDTALTVRNVLLGGRRTGIATAAGVACGQAVWTAAASAGLAALLLASAPLFTALKFAGALYLFLLGAQALRDAFRPEAAAREQRWQRSGPSMSPLTGYRQGLVSNLGNPKMAVFFTSLAAAVCASG